MEDKIKDIIEVYCEKIIKEADTNTITKSVKSIDVIVQKMYVELYSLRDGRCNSNQKTNVEKKGHCC